MTSRFVLDEFNLDLAATSFLVALGFHIIIVVVVGGAVDRVVVIDERVVADGGAREGLGMGVERPLVAGEVGALTLVAHCGGRWGEGGLLHVEGVHWER